MFVATAGMFRKTTIMFVVATGMFRETTIMFVVATGMFPGNYHNVRGDYRNVRGGHRDVRSRNCVVLASFRDVICRQHSAFVILFS